MPTQTIKLFGQQEAAFKKMQDFCKNPDKKVFILSGYAGTGKTTLLNFFLSWLRKEHYANGLGFNNIITSERKQYIPMASTGRAAKVLRDKTGQLATTIHSRIYNFKGFNQDLEKLTKQIEQNKGEMPKEGKQLLLDFDTSTLVTKGDQTTIYIIDEASMVSDTPDPNPSQAQFGTGRLLYDLFHYDPNGKFIFVGDDCQLPPINGDISPALSSQYIQTTYHLNTETATLTQIIRQSNDNDIIQASSIIRSLCFNPPQKKWAIFPLKGYNHIKIQPNEQEMIDKYVAEVKANGYNATTLISGSNSRCTQIASTVRGQLGFTDSQLMEGELLLVTQNNLSCNLINGDMVRVRSTGLREQRANLTFLHVEVEELLTGRVHSTMLIEDLLYSAAINLNRHQQQALFIDFYYREKEHNIKQYSEDFSRDLREDPYLNALRCTYGYAITCHKAQGGEWPKVFLDIPRRLSHFAHKDAYQWLYTAITRASDTLFLTDDFYLGYPHTDTSTHTSIN